MATRRNFLGRGAAAAAGLMVIPAAGLRALASQAARADGTGSDPEAWLDRMRGEDRVLFDSPEPRDGRMLYLIRHYYDTYRDVYGAPEGTAAAAGTFYGGTVAFAFRDRTWSDYRLGALGGITDPATGAPAVRNPWRADPVLGGRPARGSGIEALQHRGALFLVCHAALKSLAGRIAENQGLEPEAARAGLEEGIMPGVVLVPSVIVAIQRAQKRGVSYYRIA